MTLLLKFGARRLFFAKTACLSLSLLFVFSTTSPVRAQSANGPTIRVTPAAQQSDPIKSPPTRPNSAAGRTGKRRTSQASGGAKLSSTDNLAPANGQNSTNAPGNSSALTCEPHVYLVQIVSLWDIEVLNGQPNTTYSVDVYQDSPDILGLSLNFDGPFSSAVAVNVTTDGAGYGKTHPAFWLKGTQIGQTNIYTRIGAGTPHQVAITIIPQCHCPAIPVTQ